MGMVVGPAVRRPRASGAALLLAALVLLLLPATVTCQHQPAPPPPRPPLRSSCATGGKCTVQELTDRLLADHSRHTDPNLASAEAADADAANCRDDDTVSPNMVDAQIYVTKLGSIDQKSGSFEIEGYFRLWWTDSRLVWDARAACVRSIQLLDGPSNIWVPDFYFPPSVDHTIGAKHDGQMVKITPDGQVYWSQRLRLTVNCKMNFHQLPYDEQRCEIVMGSYSQGADEVNFQWRPGKDAMDKLDEQTNSEWIIGEQVQSEQRIPGLNPKVRVEFTLHRIPERYEETITEMMIFVFLSYLGSWIQRGAAPARVALSIITILVATSKTNSVAATLPPVAYKVWLVDFEFGCVCFCVMGFIQYTLVNFGMQQDAHLSKLRKEAAAAAAVAAAAAAAVERSDTAANPLAVEDAPSGPPAVELEAAAVKPRSMIGERKETVLLVKTARLKHLDLWMRW